MKEGDILGFQVVGNLLKDILMRQCALFDEVHILPSNWPVAIISGNIIWFSERGSPLLLIYCPCHGLSYGLESS